jgi:hypothetical protein
VTWLVVPNANSWLRTTLPIALLVLPGAAGASIDGPELVDVLGWSASEHAAYVRVTHVNESGEHAWIVRLHVQEHGPAATDTLAWSRGSDGEPEYARRVAALRRGLTTLEEVPATTIAENRDVSRLDSLRSHSFTAARYRVRVSWFGGVCEGTIEAVTYEDPSLRLLRVYRVPGTERWLGIVSFLGLPFESGYELQSALVLPGRGEIVRIPEAGPYR